MLLQCKSCKRLCCAGSLLVFCLLCSVRSAVRLVGLEITGAQALLTEHLLAPSLASCLNLQLTSVHRVLSGRARE